MNPTFLSPIYVDSYCLFTSSRPEDTYNRYHLSQRFHGLNYIRMLIPKVDIEKCLLDWSILFLTTDVAEATRGFGDSDGLYYKLWY